MLNSIARMFSLILTIVFWLPGGACSEEHKADKAPFDEKVCKLDIDNQMMSMLDEIDIELWSQKSGIIGIASLSLSGIRDNRGIGLEIVLQRFSEENGSKTARVFVKAKYIDSQGKAVEKEGSHGNFVYPDDLAMLPNVWCSTAQVGINAHRAVLESLGQKEVSDVELSKKHNYWVLYYNAKEETK